MCVSEMFSDHGMFMLTVGVQEPVNNFVRSPSDGASISIDFLSQPFPE